MKISNKIYSLVVACIATATALTSCESTQYPDPQPASAASSLSARVLFVNASPDAPALNFFLNNLASGTNIATGASTAYNTAPVGSVQLKGKATSGNIGGLLGSADLLFRAGATNQTNFTMVTATNYTFFITDTLNRARPTTLGATDPGGPRFLSVTDNLAAPIQGNTHVRFFHLSPNAPAVWVNVLDGTKVITSFANRTYRAISTGTGATLVNFANFTPIAAGEYTIEVRTGSATGPVALSIPKVALANGKIYTLFARGLVRGTGDRALGAGITAHN